LAIAIHEMEWTTRYFLAKANEWRLLRDGVLSGGEMDHRSGNVCYAERQLSMWCDVAVHAQSRHRIVNPGFVYMPIIVNRCVTSYLHCISIDILLLTIMDATEEARQAFLDFLFSRLNAAFNAFVDDTDREEQARWWHENLQIEMVSSFTMLTTCSYK